MKNYEKERKRFKQVHKDARTDLGKKKSHLSLGKNYGSFEELGSIA